MEDIYFSDSEKVSLSEITQFLKRKWPLARLKLFGSRVRGTADEESDIDLLILLPCNVTAEIRRIIVEKVFEINLIYGSNISLLIVSEDEWQRGRISVLPIHDFIEEEGIAI
ncbi:MAG TPA: hypothetical protein DDX84_00435 [Nitrospiraceae bacterium]|nr:hypothetical protein [Nitrospiraceae bacterium]